MLTSSSGFPFVTVLGLIPLIGIVAVVSVPRGRDLLAKQVALAASLLTLLVAVAMWGAYDTGGGRFQVFQSDDWPSTFGGRFGVGVDRIGLALILTTAGLTP